MTDRQAKRERLTLLTICAAILVVVFYAGRQSQDAPECISCSVWALQPTAVVSCEPRRCPTGPVLWSDVFKKPKRGGFTVTIPEGSWRIAWQLEHHQ